MTRPDRTRWDEALREMRARWKLIVEKIDARDGGAVLALANMLDEFCELAAEERKALVGDRNDPAVPILKFSPDDDVGGRCAFCRAFAALGGCFRPLHDLNKAVLNGRWEAARRVAEDRLTRLRALALEGRPEETIH